MKIDVDKYPLWHSSENGRVTDNASNVCLVGNDILVDVTDLDDLEEHISNEVGYDRKEPFKIDGEMQEVYKIDRELLANFAKRAVGKTVKYNSESNEVEVEDGMKVNIFMGLAFEEYSPGDDAEIIYEGSYSEADFKELIRQAVVKYAEHKEIDLEDIANVACEYLDIDNGVLYDVEINNSEDYFFSMRVVTSEI